MLRAAAIAFSCFVMLAFQGCATTVDGLVSRFHSLPPGPKNFLVLPVAEQASSLEFRSYARLVESALVRNGWKLADPSRGENVDVAVFLEYDIGAARQVVSSYPIIGAVPGNTSYTTGTISSQGNFGAATIRNSSIGVVGSGVVSNTVYDRSVRLFIASTTATADPHNKYPRVYEAEIRSTGATSSAPAIVPTLIAMLLADFPGESGRVVKVSSELIR